MPEHNFTLVIAGDVDAHIDELFEAGCDDATFGAIDGVPYADFTRDADTLVDALVTAIRDVESVSGLRVMHVEPDELVTQADIAHRVGRSRESIRLLAAGQRGSGDFPAPISHLRSRNRLWRWTDVAAWAGTATADDLGASRVLAATNAALELRNQSQQLPEPAVRELVALGASAGGSRRRERRGAA